MVSTDYADSRRFEQYRKRHPREYGACFENLARIVRRTNETGDPSLVQVAFFRSEFGNVWRIGQTGVPHARETRLYVYAVRIGRIFHILTIGDKDTQQADLAKCARIVATIERNSAS